ncbi:unnamed protein product, partial [Adineta ricciae]
PTERKPKLGILRRTQDFSYQFNLFPSIPPTTDEHKLRKQRVSTRLLILLLIVSLFTLLLYTASINITQIIQVEKPSLQKYFELYRIHGQTLSCNCTEISINYKKFIDIQYSLHQVCQSDFVTQKWINYLAISFGGVPEEHMNFQMVGAFIFQGLSTLCSLVNETISNRLTQFYSNQYISAFVTPKDIFESQTTTFIDQFKSSTTAEFLASLTMIRNITQSNALVSSLFTNFMFEYDYYRGPARSWPRKYGDCTCALSHICVVTATISDFYGTSRFSIPGLYVGCYIIEALLQSNLQCFYDNNCINTLKSYFTESTPMNVTPLNESLSNRFLKDSTIENILKELMVEKWNSSSTYGKYYNECQLSQCIYTKLAKNGVLYIVTTVIGLLGGLTTVLKILVPGLVTFISNMKRRPSTRIAINMNQLPRIVYQRLKAFLLTFNLFPSIPPTIDEHKLRKQRISTRLFIILLTLSLSILLLYNSLINIIQIIQVEKPSLQKYSALYHKHSQTLTCDCTEISINYKKFIDIQYSLHQVCQSDFVTQKWIKSLATQDSSDANHMNFRTIAVSTFQTLKTLCSLVNETISTQLDQFYSNQYVSASLVSLDLFESQTNTSISQFISSITANFLISLRMIRSMTQSNSLLNGYFTNYVFNRSSGATLKRVRSYDNCTCNSSPRCVVTATISDSYGTSRFSIPGLYVGCYIIEALLQSNLQCFYNITCINRLKSYFSESASINFTPLNEPLSNNFSKDSTIENIVKKLMIEKWNSSNTYGKYYSECEPSKCSYTKTTKNSAIYIVNTLFGLIGGLITALKMFVPKFVSFVDFCIRKWRSRRIQVISSSTD